MDNDYGFLYTLQHLCVPHGSRRVVIDASEITVPIDQRRTHHEVLRHAHQRVVDSCVACAQRNGGRKQST